MENKNRNLLLLALAGLGVYYFLKNKKTTTSVVPPTTGELPQRPVDQIITPVEPVYKPPVFEERDPIYNEPIYNAPRVDAPIEYTPERGKIDVPPPSIIQPPIYDYVQPPASIWDEPIIYDPYIPRQIITPVEPIYNEPIYQQPVYKPEPIYDSYPNERIKTPVEPIYSEPIYEQPIYQPEPIYEEPVYQPEPTPYYNNNVEYSEYGGSVTDFANNQSWLGMLYERDEPIEYDFEQKRR